MEKENIAFCDAFLEGNQQIERAIQKFKESHSDAYMMSIYDAIQMRAMQDGHFICPVDAFVDEMGERCFDFKTVTLEDDRQVPVAFTSYAEAHKAPETEMLSNFIDSIFEIILSNEMCSGLLLNPWGEFFFLSRENILVLMELIRRRRLSIIEHKKMLEELDFSEQPFVNAHINNISFPTSIVELEDLIYVYGMYNIEDILTNTDSNWTVPRASQIGDIVLFFHAKTAIARITALITAVHSLPDDTNHDKPLLLDWLERARRLYKRYGGKIFAVARVTGRPEYWPSAESEQASYHWKGRVYADIGNIVVLKTPIDINEFNHFIKISRQSAITPLPSEEFHQIRDIILKKNDGLPAYFLRCEIGDLQLSSINQENFLDITQKYRRRFLLETYFRSYYVDHLLKALSGSRFYRECACCTAEKPRYFVDNVFQFNGRYYLLEVKLNIWLERDLVGQLKQYLDADYLYLTKQETKRITDFERDYIYVIDTCGFYRYDRALDDVTMLINLDDVKTVDDIRQLL